MKCLARVAISFVFLSLASAVAMAQLETQDVAPIRTSRRLLVRFKSAAQPQDMARLHTVLRAQVLRQYRIVEGLQAVEVPREADLAAVLAAYRIDPAVEYAEPDMVRRMAETIPNDPKFGSL